MLPSEAGEADLEDCFFKVLAFAVETEDGEASDEARACSSCFERSTERPLGVFGSDAAGDGAFPAGDALSRIASPSGTGAKLRSASSAKDSSSERSDARPKLARRAEPVFLHDGAR